MIGRSVSSVGYIGISACANPDQATAIVTNLARMG
jgi:hypothetical protein